MFTSQQRQGIVRQEVRKVLAQMTPNLPSGKYSGAQISYAEGRGSSRAVALMDARIRASAHS